MFGYVKISEDELLVRNLKKYKSAYCSLCKQIGCYSQISRMLLSYDMVFCVLLSGVEIPIELCKCKKRGIRHCKKTCGEKTLQYLAAVSIMLQYHKLQDDVVDGKKSRRFLMYAIESGFRKAKKDYPDIEKRISTAMEKLLEQEQNNCADWNVMDNSFPSIMQDIFLLMPNNDDNNKVKGLIAMHVVAWVYWFDMFKDIEEDKRNHNYNFVNFYEESEVKRNISLLLKQHIAKADELSDILPHSDEISIVKNIIEYGLQKQMLESDLLV